MSRRISIALFQSEKEPLQILSTNSAITNILIEIESPKVYE